MSKAKNAIRIKAIIRMRENVIHAGFSPNKNCEES